MTKEIPLTQGQVSLVDDEDFEWLNQWNWFAMARRQTFYARREGKTLFGRRTAIFLHRVIMDAPKGMQVDHINGDGRDNRRSNLRLATNAENCRNRQLPSVNTSGYKGVVFKSEFGKWRATIGVNSSRIHLGYFESPIEAARAYDEAARKYFGEFARTNFQ